jgi:glucose-1-phosphate adenylyltransferase
MNNSVIGAQARVERSIIDKRVVVGEGSIVGWGDDNTPNRAMPNHLNTGLTMIGKRAQVPAGIRIGRNVVVRPRVAIAASGAGEVASGETL